VRAVIFDLDGVIIDSEKFNFKVIKTILAKHHYALSEEEYIKDFLGKRIKISLADFLGKDAKLASMIAKECLELKKELLLTKATEEISLREGAIDCVKRLYRDFPLGLYTSTNKEFTKMILRSFNLSFYFNEITSGDEVKWPKPNPEGYLVNAQKMRMSPHFCVAIEDSELGVKAAVEAGMKCIAVPNEYTKRQNLAQAHMVLRSFKDITPELINKLLV
jgi:HAD superfamily hydrolase (TIGR01509 family)